MFVRIVLNEWGSSILLRLTTTVEDCIKAGLLDPDSEVRLIFVTCFESYNKVDPQKAKLLFKSLESRTRNLIIDHIPELSSRPLEPIPLATVSNAVDNGGVSPQNLAASRLPKPVFRQLSLPKPQNLDQLKNESLVSDRILKTRHLSETISKENTTELANSSMKALFGPPGFTPFVGKHTSSSLSGLNVDHIEEQLMEVRIEGLLDDLTCADVQRVFAAIDSLEDLFRKKNKISLDSISKIRKTLVNALQTHNIELIERFLSALGLFVSSYTYDSDNWIDALVSRVLTLAVHPLSHSLTDAICRLFENLMSSLNEEPLLVAMMQFAGELLPDCDFRLVELVSLCLEQVLNGVSNVLSKPSYEGALTNFGIWSTQTRCLSTTHDRFRRLYQLMHDLNPDSFVHSYNLLTLEQQKVIKKMAPFVTNSQATRCIEIPDEHITIRRHRTYSTDDNPKPCLKTVVAKDNKHKLIYGFENFEIAETGFDMSHVELTDQALNEIKIKLAEGSLHDRVKFVETLSEMLAQNSSYFLKNATFFIDIISETIADEDGIVVDHERLLDLMLLAVPIKQIITLIHRRLEENYSSYLGTLIILKRLLGHKSFLDQQKTVGLAFVGPLVRILETGGACQDNYCLGCLARLHHLVGHNYFVASVGCVSLEKKTRLFICLENNRTL